MKDALYYNGTPDALYELNSECFSVPVDVPDRGKSHRLYVRLQPLDFSACKKILMNATPSRVQQLGSNVIDQVSPADEPLRAVADAKILALSGLVNREGKPLDKEAQLKFLAARPAVKELIVIAAAMNIGRPSVELSGGGAVDTPLVFEEDGDTEEIDAEITIADLEKQEEVVLPIQAVLKTVTQADREAYNKVTKTRSRMEGKQQITWTTTNYESISKIFDRRVISFSGAVIDGAECTEANKELWIGRLPFTWKGWLLAESFNRVESKNG